MGEKPKAKGEKAKTDTPADAQTVIQINIYRKRDGRYEYLLFKRLDEDDPFWMPISQTMTKDGNVADTLKQAAEDQAGITGFRHLSHELYSYEWYSQKEQGKDIVFAAEVSPDLPIFPDLLRYSTFEWMPYKDALLSLKWGGNKQSLRQLQNHLEEKDANEAAKATNPEEAAHSETQIAETEAANPVAKEAPKEPEISKETEDPKDTKISRPALDPPEGVIVGGSDDEEPKETSVFPL